MSDDSLRQIIDLASRFIEKYRYRPSIEGIVLFGSQVVGAIDEQSDIDLLFVLSDSLLPKIEKVWRDGMGDTPVGGLWYECETFDDRTLPASQYYTFEGKTIDCLSAAVQMARNECRTVLMFHSFLQEGIIIYDKDGKVTELSNEILSSLEDILESQRKKSYDAFEDLSWSLKRFVKQGDMSSAEIISFECCKAFLGFMFALKKQMSKYYQPQTLKKDHVGLKEIS